MGLRSIRSVGAIVPILLCAQFASAQTTTRASVSSAGFESNGSAGAVDMTPDGRFIAFYSAATNLTPEATAGVFWRDLVAGVTLFVAPGANGPVTISDDGQVVVFAILGGPPGPGRPQQATLFFWEAASRSVQEVATASIRSFGSVSGNGRYVGHTAPGTAVIYDRLLRTTVSFGATNPSPPKVTADGSFIFVTRPGGSAIHKVNVQTRETTVVTVTAAGEAGEGFIEDVSADGRFALFQSSSAHFPGTRAPTPFTMDLFLKDTHTGALTQINVNGAGQRFEVQIGFGYVFGSGEPAISADGRWITFTSSASNIVSGDTNGLADAFLYDRLSGEFTRVSIPAAGGEARTGASYSGNASADGRYVVFGSAAHEMVPGDTNFAGDIFVRDLQSGSAPPCPIAISPSGLQIVSRGGGASTVSVSAAPSCAWQAVPTAPWIHLSGTASGMGNGTIDVSFEPFAGPSSIRSGAIVANGAAVGLRQLATTTPPLVHWDEPAAGTDAVARRGAVPFTGWAVDDVQVTRIRLYRDPIDVEGTNRILIGDAVQVQGARPDVAALFSQYPYNAQAGWGLHVLSNMLPNQGNGTFTFYVHVDDAEGHTQILGPRTVRFDNVTAAEPFGTIDTPAQGQTVSGTIVNFGWALTPQPASIPGDGSTISVFIDGVNVGRPSYGHSRSDIATLFSGYANSNGAIGHFTIDTRAYADGVHTIAWVVTDSLGKASGIGSRYFTIQNGATPVTPPFVRSEPQQAAARSTQPILRVRGDEARWMAPDASGVYEIRVRDLDRIELRLDPWHGAASCGTFTAAALPAGASIDARSGVLAWQPAAGVGGTHDIAVTRTSCGGVREQLTVRIVFDTR